MIRVSSSWIMVLSKSRIFQNSNFIARLICWYFHLLAKVLGHSKHTTAEELYKLVLMKKTTYEEIRRIDPNKFMDLEATMRMLYDHGDMIFEDSNISSSQMPPQTTPMNSISPTNASMREPKGPSTISTDRGSK